MTGGEATQVRLTAAHLYLYRAGREHLDHDGTWGPDHGDTKGGTSGQTCRFQWNKSLVTMMAHGGQIMGTRKVAQVARPIGSVGAKVRWHEEARSVREMAKRLVRRHSPRGRHGCTTPGYRTLSTDRAKAEGHIHIHRPGGRRGCTTPGAAH